jgi:hypothetical protein
MSELLSPEIRASILIKVEPPFETPALATIARISQHGRAFGRQRIGSRFKAISDECRRKTDE